MQQPTDQRPTETTWGMDKALVWGEGVHEKMNSLEAKGGWCRGVIADVLDGTVLLLVIQRAVFAPRPTSDTTTQFTAPMFSLTLNPRMRTPISWNYTATGRIELHILVREHMSLIYIQ